MTVSYLIPAFIYNKMSLFTQDGTLFLFNMMHQHPKYIVSGRGGLVSMALFSALFSEVGSFCVNLWNKILIVWLETVLCIRCEDFFINNSLFLYKLEKVYGSLRWKNPEKWSFILMTANVFLSIYYKPLTTNAMQLFALHFNSQWVNVKLIAVKSVNLLKDFIFSQPINVIHSSRTVTPSRRRLLVDCIFKVVFFQSILSSASTRQLPRNAMSGFD